MARLSEDGNCYYSPKASQIKCIDDLRNISGLMNMNMNMNKVADESSRMKQAVQLMNTNF